MFCVNCGKEVNPNADYCVNCGTAIRRTVTDPNAKSKLAAGLLGILLGGLGIHNFYLGYTGKAITQLLLSTVGVLIIVGPIIAGIWGLVEGIQILTGSIDRDASGRLLRD